MILEAAVDPGDGTFASLTDKQRLKTTYNLCLVDRCALCWIEPLLYKVVVLDLDTQAISFTYALKNKSAEFLSRCVRALWILQDCESLDRIDYVHLFSTLRGLESLALPGDKLRMLRAISTPSSIRDLILVQPRASIADRCLYYLNLRSLHIIDVHGIIFRKPIPDDGANQQYPYESFLIQFSALPRICIDFTKPPRFSTFSYFAKLSEMQANGEQLQMDGRSSHFTFISDDEKFEEQRTQPRSLWVKQDIHSDTDRRAESPSSWSQPIYAGVQFIPNGRHVWVESPVAELPKYKRAPELPLIQQITEMIHYNEVHWDEIARRCDTESTRKGA